MRKTSLAVIGSALLGAGLIAVACAAQPAPRSTTTTVEIRDFVFAPVRVEVAAGDTIAWVNRDAVPHTASAASGAWDSGELRTGATWKRVATAGETIEYVCAYHPSMRGTIVVSASLPRTR